MTVTYLRVPRLWAGVLFCTALTLSGCGLDRKPLLPETSVTPLASEDLAQPCVYALRVTDGPVPAPGQPPSSIPQTAVLVVFERADSLNLFDDPLVIAAAQKLHMSMVYAYECDAKSFSDIQPIASAGPGRALFQALSQFAVSQSHPELANAKVFLTGFSASAALSITTTALYPDRVLGVLPYAPGSNHVNVSTIPITPQSARIPALIMVSANDTSAGDTLPLQYFQQGWAQKAPWGFASQHAVNHCCLDSIAPLLIPWMNAIFAADAATNSSGGVSLTAKAFNVTPTVAFQIASDGNFDPVGYQDFFFGSYSVLPDASGGPFEAWLPDATTTQAWVNWISAPNGNNNPSN